MAENEVRLAYSGVILFVSKILSVGTGLVFSLMVTRSLIDPRLELGIYSNLNDTLGYFVLPATIIPFWTTRFTARNHAGAPKTGLTANLVLSAIFAAIYLLLLPAITSAFQIGEAYAILYIVVVFQILELFTLHGFEAILHAKQPQKIAYGFLIFEVCKVILGYALIVHQGLTGPAALLAAVTSIIIAYTLQFIFYLRLTAHELRGKVKWGYLKEWFKASPVNLYNIGGQRLAVFVLILLFIFEGEARGDFRAGQIIANIIVYSSFLAFALYPKLLSKTDPKDVSASLKLVLMFAIPMTVGAIVLSDSYVTIMRPEFGLAGPVLMILALNALCLSMLTVFGFIISGTEKVDEKAKIPFRKLVKTRLFLIYTLPYIKAGVLLPLTYFFLTTMTETTIGAATFVAAIILLTDIPLLFATYAIAKRCVDFRMPWKNIAKYVVASTIMGVVLFFIPQRARILYTLAVTLLGGAIYLLTLLATDGEARSLGKVIIQEALRMTKLSKR
ncbi:MAG: hypothetical protein JSW53_00505 [Candidatus Bathyarchaeota archaeon]|nr:MAG: hypothetical protein JSW53_00505 [Candidatus Bathyarchaeota archaeon]